MIESVSVNEWKAEAATKTRREAVVTVLEAGFGPLPANAKGKVESTTSLDVLQQWIILAAKTDSMDAFRRDAGI